MIITITIEQDWEEKEYELIDWEWVEIDKNIKIKINIPWIVNRGNTITDAQIAVVKTLSKLRIQQDTTTIKSVSITIE